MPKPVCVPCQRFFRPKKNGYVWIEAMPIEADAPPGTAKPEAWKPYKLWNSDMMECQGCGAQIVVGHGRGPMSEHYHPDFAGWTGDYPPQLTVNDC